MNFKEFMEMAMVTADTLSDEKFIESGRKPPHSAGMFDL